MSCLHCCLLLSACLAHAALQVLPGWQLGDRGCQGPRPSGLRLGAAAGQRGWRECFRRQLRRVPCSRWLLLGLLRRWLRWLRWRVLGRGEDLPIEQQQPGCVPPYKGDHSATAGRESLPAVQAVLPAQPGSPSGTSSSSSITASAMALTASCAGSGSSGGLGSGRVADCSATCTWRRQHSSLASTGCTCAHALAPARCVHLAAQQGQLLALARHAALEASLAEGCACGVAGVQGAWCKVLRLRHAAQHAWHQRSDAPLLPNGEGGVIWLTKFLRWAAVAKLGASVACTPGDGAAAACAALLGGGCS